VVLLGIVLSFIPPGETVDKFAFEVELIGATGVAILIGLVLHYFGAGKKESRRGARVDGNGD